MKKRIRLLVAAFLLALTAVPLTFAQDKAPAKGTSAKKDAGGFHCGRQKTKVYDLSSSNVTGDQIRGPRTIRADNLNVLRYHYNFSATISFSRPADLWSQLQSAALPAPAKKPPEPAMEPLEAAEAPKRAVAELAGKIAESQKAGRKVPLEVEKRALEAMTQAQQQITAARSIISAAEGVGEAKDHCSAGVPTGLNLTEETNRQSRCLANQVSSETHAVNQVKFGGQSLISLLQRSNTAPSLLIGYVAQALKSDSLFMKGIGAEWPEFTRTATLRRSAEAWKSELARRKTAFNEGLIKILGPLNSAKTDLSHIKNSLAEASKKGERPTLIETSNLVQSNIKLIDDRKDALTKTGNLLDWAIGENQRVLSAIPDLEESSSKYKDFQKAQQELVTWQARMTDLKKRWDNYEAGVQSGKSAEENPNPFSLSTSADCGFAFSRTKTTSITLKRVDLMPGTTTTGPETVLSVNVECTSPFTVSAGVVFSTIASNQFAIQPTPPENGTQTGTVNEIVKTSSSSFHPLPLGMVHARVCEFNEEVALHISFGVAGNFQSQNAGGSSAEFIVGPSVSLFRTMFFTPGLYIGTETNLRTGFSLNQEVPSSITTVPLTKSYTTGFGFAITFTKP